MVRKSATSLVIDPNVRCNRIIPTEKSKKTLAELQTIGIRVNRQQALHLARVLLAATQEWEEIDITGWRFKKRKSDGTYNLTITSRQPEED